MKHTSLDKEKVQVDFTSMNLPAPVLNFRPDVYTDGDRYYCVLGAGTEQSVFGEGNTVEEALLDWEKAYHERSGK
ncbi:MULTISPECIES: hypothetical protein [unclassified Chitinophaga]|uniref:hypothetical protein n=1 Tax=unclassified Chitinophaga TaxID=2619133 RepID=UPI0009CB84D5|nr:MULTISPECIES: hypothetical protein [unclassified Chitinophaga]OMP79005.1 hypothetical protein BW716_11630 [[Flexibacter] sp. ATCC 35208]WPV70227.1 hypothetical protein QQL36_16090 [Chitinophaga sp. LS1]